MSNFDDAVKVVMGNEGGYSANPQDHGGSTNFGISQRFLNDICYYHALGDRITDVKDLTQDDAIKICHDYFWKPNLLDEVVNQLIATKILDMLFNMGIKDAMKLIQRSCIRTLPTCGLVIDGIMGENTVNTLNSLPSDKLLNVLRSECALHYEIIIALNPSQAVFRDGWLKRAYE